MAKAVLVDAPADGAVPVEGVTPDGLEAALANLSADARAFVAAAGFTAARGTIALVPGPGGVLARVLFGLGGGEGNERTAFLPARLAALLPPGDYRLAGGFPDPAMAALAFGLGAYRFARYKGGSPATADIRLAIPEGVDAAELRRIVDAVSLARDLVNTPANDLGPAELAGAIRAVAEQHGAAVTVIAGEALEQDFPMVHAVGAAATPDRAPRLVDLVWGDPDAPKVTLVGKGVVFDTGGLDLKPSSNMLLMKKDMGGAANALALAALVMSAKLPVRLRLIVPTVENAVASASFRPGDVLRSRKGLTVEIGNTDAEGRLILADALALAGEEEPDLLIDLATLTGAARVALGPDLPAVFTPDDALAADLARHGEATADPSWRLPLWRPYLAMVESKVADINNAGTGGLAGAITAALFLQRFVARPERWMHIDIFGWTPSSKPGQPEGGEAQTIRALYALLKERYPPG
ncbi:MAG: leucyl aminopeptidase family protein [Bauldia sp.]|nr:leucyl aminopeptidase family protein [Bauldia sp.]